MKKSGGTAGQNVENKSQLPQWDRDWNLQPMNAHGLVDEYLEMGESSYTCNRVVISIDLDGTSPSGLNAFVLHSQWISM